MSAAPTPARRPDPEPLQVDEVRVVAVGTALWAVAFVVLLAFRGRLEAHHTGWWLWVPVAGFWLGLLGVWFLRRRRAAIARGARRNGN